MKKVIVMCLAVGLMATAANAAMLSMKWADTTSPTKTLNPSDYATIDLVWTWMASDVGKGALGVTDIDGRINVWGHQPINPETEASAQVPANAIVTGVTSTMPGANTAVSNPIGGDLDWFFFAVNDFAVQVPAASGSIVLGSITIHCAGPSAITYISFSAIAPSPSVRQGTSPWTHRWQTPINGHSQFKIGQGNSGDLAADWNPYHNYETFQPLTLIQTPEPSALVLLALGGLAILRRR
jgi:hypothetical protein